MRTTLDLPDPLFRKIKARAAEEGLKLKELLTTYIEAGLDAGLTPGKLAGRQPLPPPVRFRRAPGEPHLPARSNAELHALLESEEAGKVGTEGESRIGGSD